MLAADAGTPGNVLRVGLTQVPPKFLINCGALVIEHRFDPYLIPEGKR